MNCRQRNGSHGAIVAITIAAALALPYNALAQDAKPSSRAMLNLLQDAFISIAEELEPAVVTVTATLRRAERNNSSSTHGTSSSGK